MDIEQFEREIVYPVFRRQLNKPPIQTDEKKWSITSVECLTGDPKVHVGVGIKICIQNESGNVNQFVLKASTS